MGEEAILWLFQKVVYKLDHDVLDNALDTLNKVATFASGFEKGPLENF